MSRILDASLDKTKNMQLSQFDIFEIQTRNIPNTRHTFPKQTKTKHGRREKVDDESASKAATRASTAFICTSCSRNLARSVVSLQTGAMMIIIQDMQQCGVSPLLHVLI